jgi:hypothetical protein
MSGLEVERAEQVSLFVCSQTEQVKHQEMESRLLGRDQHALFCLEKRGKKKQRKRIIRLGEGGKNWCLLSPPR